MSRKATETEESIASDETGGVYSLKTGELLRAKGLCPFVIVRTYGAGVHTGYLARIEGQEVELLEGRRIWSWKEANTLHEVALDGIAEASNISKPLPNVLLHSAIETLPVSDTAKHSLVRSRWNRR